MSDLSRSLVDAAAEAVHEVKCGCGGSIADADEHRETARIAVGAAVEALADWLKTKDPDTNVHLDRLVAEIAGVS